MWPTVSPSRLALDLDGRTLVPLRQTKPRSPCSRPAFLIQSLRMTLRKEISTATVVSTGMVSILARTATEIPVEVVFRLSI
jgi:hypothetical protein